MLKSLSQCKEAIRRSFNLDWDKIKAAQRDAAIRAKASC